MVISLWIAILLIGGIATGKVVNRLSYNFAIPGQKSYIASQTILKHFGNGGQNPPAILAINDSQLLTNSILESTLTQAQTKFTTVRFVDTFNSPKLKLSSNSQELVYLFTPPPNSLGSSPVPNQIQAFLQSKLPQTSITLTGESQLASAGTSGGNGVLVETVIAGIGALAILAFVFASFLAVIPLIIAAVSVLATFLVLLVMSYITQVSFVVEFLVSLIGLGIAIDYSLLIVTRWREERTLGRDNHDAIVRAMSTAGRSVALSGITVAIGLLSLIVLPVPLLRSTGIGGVLIPIISVSVVLTLLPALLASIGPRLEWPHRPQSQQGSKAWNRIATTITNNPWKSFLISAIIIAIFVSPVFSIKLGQDQARSQSTSTPAAKTYQTMLTHGFSPGILTPIEILTSNSNASGVAEKVRTLPGIVSAELPGGSMGTSSGISDVIAIPELETVNSANFAQVNEIESLAQKDPQILGVAGLGANDHDFSHAIYGNAPFMLAIIALLTLIILAAALKSVVLALKAIVLNLLSLGATFGILTWFWQMGHLSKLIFNIPATGAITFWIPISIFAFLFGLSMDYEVFILTRIREEYDKSGSTTLGIINGISRTGKLVTSAALILFLAFVSLASAPLTDIRVLATGLGIGILLDATLIRGILVPSLIQLLGRANWWYPSIANRNSPSHHTETKSP